MIVNTVNIEGISLMGSAGFLIVFAAVNLAAVRVARRHRSPRAGGRGRRRLSSGRSAPCCGTPRRNIPAQLLVLAGLVGGAVLGEVACVRGRKRTGVLTDPDGRPAAPCGRLGGAPAACQSVP